MQVYLYAIGISELHNVTICEGGSKAFKCIINSSISSDDVQWYRLIMDTGTTERVNQSSNIHFNTSTINNTLTSLLNITNATKSHTGYYWPKLPSDDICSNISLTVTTSTCVYAICYSIKTKVNVFLLKCRPKIFRNYEFKRE